MSNAGIDYGMGKSNVDVKNGIRYGVISQNSVTLEYSDLEYDYGDPACPKCGGDVHEYSDDRALLVGAATLAEGVDGEFVLLWDSSRGCYDYMCDQCEYVCESSEVYGDEVIGWHYDSDCYQLQDCLDNDIFVLASPYYTYAQFCSPCVPGAGNLDSACEAGVKTYCLGHDWFESSQAPYPVYSVKTEKEVLPD